MKDKTICGTSRSSSRMPASYQRATKNATEMSEQAVIYVDLKFQTPSKQQKKKTPKNTRDKAINEEVVTYTELKCHNASEQQRRRRTTNPQGKDSSAPVPAWWLIACFLGIFCLALLIAVGVLAANVFQISLVPCRQQDNLTQHWEITQGWKFLCPEHWFSHGEKCYHFSTESKPWLESQKACSSHDSRLLLIENKEELDFISPLATSHWIGLSRDKTDRPWMWVNGTAFSTDQFVVKKGYVDGNCALVTGGELYSGPCKESKLYICEQLVLLPKPDISA
ncbi:NKG2-A/NKG2-B type II integral membrane protein-like [Mauremys mutica]|uniref:NKG2-A/NKG2-B type II integral membrane protein-like n=1 Tax=Mauremys mutica TaxID=74926 RepID=UPI001D159C83|nr:NKG2-A/NKG2-B type II integral membrane protein-like [Mauremys mutica]